MSEVFTIDELRDLLSDSLYHLRLYEKEGLLSLQTILLILNDLYPSQICMCNIKTLISSNKNNKLVKEDLFLNNGLGYIININITTFITIYWIKTS